MSSAFRNIAAATALVCGWITVPSMAQLQFQDQTTSRFPQPNLNEYTNQASVCDIDNDGDLDIAFANGQGFSAQGVALKLRIFVNSGTGTFTDESDARVGTGTPPVAWSGWARGVEFGDCDGDGDWDMIVAQDFNKRPQLFINGLGGVGGTQLGFFTNETTTRLPNLNMSSARSQFGDVDNDGDLDLIFCNSGATNRFGSGQPRIFLNDGAGFYTDATSTSLPLGNITDQQDILFADVDLDYDLDIHLASRAGQSKLWLNNGAGTFTALAGFPGGSNSYSYDFGDIDGDGDFDLLGVNGGGELLLRNTNPSTTWLNISTEISPNTAIDDNDSKFLDYDNDGDLDFIIGSLGASERIYRNNGMIGTPDFTQVSGLITTVGDATLDIEVADLTGDGRLDIVTLQGESGSFVDRIFANIGPVGVIDNVSPKVVVQQLPDVPEGTSGPFVVRAIGYDGYSSDRGFFDKGVTLHYYLNDEPEQTVPMKWVGNSMFRGVIPPIKGTGTVSYYVTATDFNNNVGNSVTRDFVIPGIAPCPADVVPNGTIDVDDLLVVINNWGNAGGLGDITGNNIVDVDDLLAVINGWGPC
jgi:hypothetical protein